MRCANSSGKSSDTEKAFFVDAIPLSFSFVGFPEDGEGRLTNDVALVFSEPVTNVTADCFSIRRGARTAVEIPDGALAITPDASNLVWTVSGIDALTASGGTYRVAFDVSRVEKLSSGLHGEMDEESSSVSSLRLDEQDPETIFGMENNKAMRFVGRGYTTSAANTLAGVPPEKRDLIYDVFDALDPLARTAEEKAKAKPVGNGAMLIARILRNYDDLADLRTDGLLDRENLVPILYGDLGVTAADDNRRINDVLGERQMERMDIVLPLMTMMNESGESLDDCKAAIQAGRRLPAAPHVSSANDHLYALDGTAKGGRGTLIGDLIRPTNPKRIGGGLLLQEEDRRFTFRFPDGGTLVAQPGQLDNEDVRNSCNAIADRIETLCGKVHPKQLSAICLALSQSGTGQNTKDAFRAQGIDSDEHMALSFELSKDDATGAVTVTCTEPKGFPVHFRWTTTVALDGTVTSTPMVVEN